MTVSEANTRVALFTGKRIPELDGLRGVAIALVIIFHYISEPISDNAGPALHKLQIATAMCWSGVDLFFVLSGFLIGGILLDERASTNYFKVFYVRRICRIFPLYLIVCAICLLISMVLYRARPQEFDWLFVSPVPWLSYPTFTQNFWMAARHSWGVGLLSVTWSLAVEEQFYLTLPAIVRFIRRSVLPYVFVTGIVLAPLVRIGLLLHNPDNRRGAYLLLPSRMDALLMGVLAAWALRRPSVWGFMVRRRRVVWLVFGVLAVGVLCLSPRARIFSRTMITAGYDWLALFYLSALVLALSNPESWLGRALRWRPLRGLGNIAYGVYLIHLAIYILCMELLRGVKGSLASWSDVAVTVVALALTIGLAQISWLVFEKPIVRWGHKMQYRIPDYSNAAELPSETQSSETT